MTGSGHQVCGKGGAKHIYASQSAFRLPDSWPDCALDHVSVLPADTGLAMVLFRTRDWLSA
ncbi:hypothetical protein TMES_06260 [Thalassospira mesophila]|uniref:Uncharacterized protein n=1 Tax=Thalassospira mesophila TaxID=1293891 RepID=A0A1Y2L4Z3_9PROT|nr:hypothetical protein TMES_06260 [Thalassospira mesophila]